MIVSFKLLAYCLLIGGGYLFLLDFIWIKLEKVVPTLTGFPADLLETTGIGWFISNYIIEFIFLVLLPSVAYGWFYTIIPFSGIRGGIAVAIFLVVFGMLPLSLLTMFRIKLPVVFMLYQLLGLLLKVGGVMIIIGYLYSL